MLNLETTTIWKIITLSYLFKRNKEKIDLNILSSGLQAEFKTHFFWLSICSGSTSIDGGAFFLRFGDSDCVLIWRILTSILRRVISSHGGGGGSLPTFRLRQDGSLQTAEVPDKWELSLWR